MLAYLIRRIASGAAVVFLTAWIAYGMMRILRPDLYFGEPVISGTWADVKHAATEFAETPVFRDGIAPDLYLLAGGVLIAVLLGVSGGIWCAQRPRSRSSRVLEALAMFFLCTSGYVIALGLLLLFSSQYGALPLPWFFAAHTYVPPQENPWIFFRSMLIPWLAVGLPVAAQILRLTLAMTIDGLGEPFVQTARSKGVSSNDVVRRHAAPTALVSVASLFGASAPMMVTNMVLIEFCWSIPGTFRFMRAALGQDPGGHGIAHIGMLQITNIGMLQILAVWASVLIVLLGLLGDLAIVRLDPQLRASGTHIG